MADTGEGIEPDFLPHLFDRFSQADGSAARQHGGLGLGLSIVKNLVELHAGTVGAFSAGNGQGAVFTVSLPRASAAAALQRGARRRRSRRAAALGEIDLRGMAILLVDDHEDVLEVECRLLAASGATRHRRQHRGARRCERLQQQRLRPAAERPRHAGHGRL